MPELVHRQRCPDTMPPPELLEHVRLMHPDVDDLEPVESGIAEGDGDETKTSSAGPSGG